MTHDSCLSGYKTLGSQTKTLLPKNSGPKTPSQRKMYKSKIAPSFREQFQNYSIINWLTRNTVTSNGEYRVVFINVA